jgi:hypothetical protein
VYFSARIVENIKEVCRALGMDDSERRIYVYSLALVEIARACVGGLPELERCPRRARAFQDFGDAGPVVTRVSPSPFF